MKFHRDRTLPVGDAIFVFGSNLAGRHGKGAAMVARRRFGAVYGVGEGLTGSAYAIPTKDGGLHVLSIDCIRAAVQKLCTTCLIVDFFHMT